MPCKGCPNNGKSANPVLMHPVLDQTIFFLTKLWITEVRAEQRESLKDLIETLQALKHPYVIPLCDQFENLRDVANEISQRVPCFYCQGATYWGMVQKVQVHLHMERGEYWQAFKLELESDAKKWYWMIRAAWLRLIRPRIHFK